MTICKRCKHDSTNAPTSTEVKTFKTCVCTCHEPWRLVHAYPTPKPAKQPAAKKAPAKKAAPRKRAAVKS